MGNTMHEGGGVIGTVLLEQAARITVAPEDYTGPDGLLVCGKCNRPKQMNVTFLGRPRKVPIACRCDEEADKAYRFQRQQEDLQRRVKELQRMGITDGAYLSRTFAEDDRRNIRVSDASRRYVDKWDELYAKNTGLLMYGSVGTGKSYYACAIANALIAKAVPAVVTNLPRLISAMQGFDGESERILKMLSQYPLVVIDDLGVERDTSYASEKVFEIFDTRYRSGKPLIVTTNLTPSELKNPAELKYKRVYDRILETCYPVKVTGDSRRQEIAKHNIAEVSELLGL